MDRLPTLFLSHGSPMLALADSAAGRFLDGLAGTVPRPRAIVVASAHFEAEPIGVGGAERPATVHDFGGFPAELHRLRYGAPGDPGLAERVVALLFDAGFSAALDRARGLDHGVWVPLIRAFPHADIPVVPLSVSPRRDARWHYALGAALAGLREEGVLVLGSGGFVHNLGDLAWGLPDAPMAPWAAAFADWMHERLASGDIEALLAWEREAPQARQAHPTPEHLLPLFVALGAAGPRPQVEVLHRSHELGSLALDAFGFH